MVSGLPGNVEISGKNPQHGQNVGDLSINNDILMGFSGRKQI
jgi:hypothetical protein